MEFIALLGINSSNNDNIFLAFWIKLFAIVQVASNGSIVDDYDAFTCNRRLKVSINGMNLLQTLLLFIVNGHDDRCGFNGV